MSIHCKYCDKQIFGDYLKFRGNCYHEECLKEQLLEDVDDELSTGYEYTKEEMEDIIAERKGEYRNDY